MRKPLGHRIPGTCKAAHRKTSIAALMHAVGEENLPQVFKTEATLSLESKAVAQQTPTPRRKRRKRDKQSGTFSGLSGLSALR